MSGPIAAFLQRLAPARRVGIVPARAADILEAAFVTGQRAWPEVPLSAEELAAHLGDTMAADAELDLDGLERLRIDDLYLAAGCALGRAPAIASFRSHFFGDIDRTLRRLGVGTSDVEELAHLVLNNILVGESGRPAIVGYIGRGTLRHWVQSVAIRTASKRHRSEKRVAATQAQLGDVMAQLDDDVELEHLRLRYAPAYEAALEAAVATLSARDRNLLRHYFIDGLTVDELGRLFHVHRATAARWVGKARENLHNEVLARLQSELGLSSSEIESLARFVRSQVDVSFSRLLR